MNIFNRKKEEDVDLMTKLAKELKDFVGNKYNETHKVCPHCNITGHTIDMKEVWDYFNGHVWFHNGCYAEKFNKHLCPCRCGKWLDNKNPTKHK